MTTRRAFLAGAGAALMVPAAAKAAAPAIGFVLIDAATGETLESRHADRPFIPASLAKIPAALRARDAFGAEARFATRLLIDGPLRDGVLAGDLHLVGGGDPALDAAELAAMAKTLRERGLRRVEGRFLYHPYALPEAAMINPRQPWQAAYNPAVGGLNLNFNRVRLLWDPEPGGPQARAQAIGDGIAAPAPSVRIALTKGDGFGHERREEDEVWRLGRGLLTGRGRRWLPVRRPGAYAAGVFRALAAEEGVATPAPQRAAHAPEGRALVTHRSASMETLLKGMLRYSTNLTAEALGAAAARKEGLAPDTLEEASEATARWLVAAADPGPSGWSGLRLANHSGLSTDSRATPAQIAAALRCGHTRFGPAFERLLVERSLEEGPDHAIRAKTGTLHFVRGLAGVLRLGERALIFAIMAEDRARRAALDAAFTPFAEATPPGARRWLSQARAEETDRLQGWIARYS